MRPTSRERQLRMSGNWMRAPRLADSSWPRRSSWTTALRRRSIFPKQTVLRLFQSKSFASQPIAAREQLSGRAHWRRGEWVLMSDVDLSAPLTEFARLAPHAEAWMTCGSRYGRAGMPLRRRILSRLFHTLVWLVGVRDIQDTQCGFKLFRMEKMRPVFETQRIERFAFDVELIKRVRRAGGSVVETPVAWHGGKRSSLRVLRDAPRMLWDLLRIA